MAHAQFRRLSLLTAVLTYLLVILGGAAKAFSTGAAPIGLVAALAWSYRLGAIAVGGLAAATAALAWRTRSENRLVVTSALASLALLAAEGVLGLLRAPALAPLHTGTTMAFFATVLAMAVSAHQGAPLRRPGRRVLWLLPLAAAVMVWVTTLLGAYVKNAGPACTGWPLCGGRVLPAFDTLVWLDFLHRLAALTTGILVAWTAWTAWRTQRTRPVILTTALAAVGIYLLQVALGAATALWVLPPAVAISHLALAGGLFGAMIALTLLLRRAAQMPAVAGGEGAAALAATAPLALAPARDLLQAYVMLMKPSIIVLLLVTTYGAMWVAAGGPPPAGVALWTLLGGTFSSGAANAINMWYDQDIDAVMRRTRRRPLPAGRLTPGQVLTFGIVAGALSFLFLGVMVNWLAAVLSLSGLLFYVFIYTMWLKRSTPQNIVIGGAAGAVPPLVGWAAITGDLHWAPVLMFLIVFLWTPPHFWALALFRTEDYRNAGVPMLPVVKGAAYTKWQILIYAVLTVLSTLALYPLGVVGPRYLVAAALAGAYFVWTSMALLRDRTPEQRSAHLVFGYSIVYLAIVFLAMVLDTTPLTLR